MLGRVHIMFMQKFIRHTVAAATLFLSALAALPAEANAVSTDFVPPAAPRRSAMPDRRLPNLGRDKHGLPFYHPKQTNRVVRTTAYTHTEGDHIVYGPSNAIGTRLMYTETLRSAAADWSVYPLGTKFKIKGEPYTYIVDDYGSALVGTATIDIYQPTPALMKKWARRLVEIEVIEWGSSARSMEVLAARRKAGHCSRMYASLQEQDSHRRK